jgi:hypothetical protein
MTNAELIIRGLPQLETGTEEERQIAALIKSVIAAIEAQEPYPPSWPSFLKAHVRLQVELPANPLGPWQPGWEISGVESERAKEIFGAFLNWLYYDGQRPKLGICQHHPCRRVYRKRTYTQRFCKHAHRVSAWQAARGIR